MAYTYLVICKPTGEWYYGVRYAGQDGDIWKTYFTSSNHVHDLIEKYGKDAFNAEVRKVFDDPRAALAWERKVLMRVLGRPGCLNKSARLGVYTPDVVDKIKETCNNIGEDGLTVYKRRGLKVSNYLNSENPDTGIKRSVERAVAIKAAFSKVGEDGLNVWQRLGKEMRGENNPMRNPEVRNKVSNSLKEYYKTHDSWIKGKTHNEESLKVMRDKKLGENNPCYDTVWVNNGVSNLRVDPNCIPDGYKIGRLLYSKLVRTERTCPACGKVGKGPNMKRYHFDNCKHRI